MYCLSKRYFVYKIKLKLSSIYSIIHIYQREIKNISKIHLTFLSKRCILIPIRQDWSLSGGKTSVLSYFFMQKLYPFFKNISSIHYLRDISSQSNISLADP